jgi:hypothetical protein
MIQNFPIAPPPDDWVNARGEATSLVRDGRRGLFGFAVSLGLPFGGGMTTCKR